MNTLEMIKNIIGEVLEANEIHAQITDDIKLVEELSVDSIVAIEILVSVEERFKIIIDDEDLDISLIETPRKLFEYVENKLK